LLLKKNRDLVAHGLIVNNNSQGTPMSEYLGYCYLILLTIASFLITIFAWCDQLN
jgi:hypothetical protein